MKVQYRAVLYDGDDGWQDSDEELASEEAADKRAEHFLNGHTTDHYVVISRIETVSRIDFGKLKKTKLK